MILYFHQKPFIEKTISGFIFCFKKIYKFFLFHKIQQNYIEICVKSIIFYFSFLLKSILQELLFFNIKVEILSTNLPTKAT